MKVSARRKPTGLEAKDPARRGRLDPVVLALPLISGTVAIATGILVLIGWSIDSDVLKGGVLGGPWCKPNTAVAMILLGTALIALKVEGGALRVLGKACGLAAFLIGVLTLAEHLFGSIGIDHLLFVGREETWARPGVLTATAIAALGVSAMMSDARGAGNVAFKIANWTAGAATIAVCAGYIHGVDFIWGGTRESGLSFFTVGVLGFLIWGYVFLRPTRGMAGYLRSSGPGPALARYLFPAAIVVPLVVGLIEETGQDAGLWREPVGRSIGTVLATAVFVVLVLLLSRRIQLTDDARRRAQATMNEQAEILRNLAEGVCMATVSDYHILYANHQFELMHGYGPGELVGEPIEIVNPSDPDEAEIAIRSQIANALERREPISYELRAAHREGNELWCRATASIIDHPDHGDVLVVVKEDITEEHRERQARGEAEERFRRVYENGPIGIALVDERFGFAGANPAFCELTGYTERELEQRSFADITHPDDLEKDLALSRQLFNGEIDNFRMEKRYVRKDGEVVWVSLTATMVRGDGGSPQYAISMVQDASEQRRLRDELRHQADHDPLTGLPNRRRFETELGVVLRQMRENRQNGGILAIDLDNFKYVNDTHGHSVGDALIKKVAAVLADHVRDGDLLARLGGDEFAVILCDSGAQVVARVAEGLAVAVREHARVGSTELAVRATASIGVALIDPDGPLAEDLMIEADVAMYDAKDAGRDRVVVYDRGSDGKRHMRHSLNWADRIRIALERDSFELFAQPIVGLGGDLRPRHELLLRLREGEGGPIPPDAFLGIVERLDLIQEVDRWVVTNAIKLLAEQQREGHRPCLEVNLSGKSIGDPRLLSHLSMELDRTGAEPSGLVFEVTETAAIANIDQAKSFATHLLEIGCGFALDDFGAGFATFYYLKHFDCDVLKIDGEFIRNLATDRTNQMVVSSLVRIAGETGKATIAEFVEDAATLDLVREYGVDYAQGYFIGKPRPVAEVDLNWTPRLEQLDGDLGAGV